MIKVYQTVDEYISGVPAIIQPRLNKIRNMIQKSAPEAIEVIAYGMPGYMLHQKPLVYFGWHTKHIGLYATPNTHEKFKKELSIYKHGKGSVQFPHHKKLPLKLIAEMIAFKVAEMK